MDLGVKAIDLEITASIATGAPEVARKSYKHLHGIAEYLQKRVRVEWPGTFSVLLLFAVSALFPLCLLPDH